MQNITFYHIWRRHVGLENISHLFGGITPCTVSNIHQGLTCTAFKRNASSAGPDPNKCSQENGLNYALSSRSGRQCSSGWIWPGPTSDRERVFEHSAGRCSHVCHSALSGPDRSCHGTGTGALA